MTGMRRGEVVAIRWQDIDWDTRVIRVRRNYTRGEFGTPKSRRSSRAVPLADRLVAELRTHHELTANHDALDLVFTNPVSGTVLDPSKLRRRFVACALQAGVRPVRFHDLRHTFGTQMAAAGAPLRAVQEWLGHTDYRTTLIYADYALDPHQGARYAELAFGARQGSQSVAGRRLLRREDKPKMEPEPAGATSLWIVTTWAYTLRSTVRKRDDESLVWESIANNPFHHPVAA